MKRFRICLKRNLKSICLVPVLLIFSAGSVFSAAAEKQFELTVSPQEVFHGSPVVIRIEPDSGIQHAATLWRETPVTFSRNSEQGCFFGVIGIDLDEPPGKKRVKVWIDDKHGNRIKEKLTFVVVEKAFPVQHLTLPPSQVSPSPENLERIRRERQQVAGVFQNATAERLFEKPFIRPLEGEISTPFGVRRFMNNEPRNPHSGVDFRASAGTPVHAANCGVVSFTGDHFFAGKSVYIDHGMGIITMYFHLSAIDVVQGQTVQIGDVIGRVGSTGRSTGPHLHWGARITNQRVDALDLLELF